MKEYGTHSCHKKRKAVDEAEKQFQHTLESVEVALNDSLGMIFQEIDKLKGTVESNKEQSDNKISELEYTVESNKNEIGELKDQMTIIINILNCRQVITVFNQIFMEKIRNKLGMIPLIQEK